MSDKLNKSIAKLQDALLDLEPAKDHIKAASEVAKNLEVIPGKLDNLADSLKSDLETSAKQVKSNLDSLKELNTTISEYFEYLKKIDLPVKFSSIEGHISSISTAVNNVQSASSTIKDELVRIERNNKDSIEQTHRLLNSNKDYVGDLIKKNSEVVTENYNQILNDMAFDRDQFETRFNEIEKKNKSLRVVSYIQLSMIIIISLIFIARYIR